MRTTDERMAEVNRRAKELKKKSRLRRDRLIGFGSAALSLVLVIGLSLAMPGMMAGLPDGGYEGVALAASIFDQGGGLGCLLIALLAFALGVSVTVLCHHLHRRNREEQEGKDD